MLIRLCSAYNIYNITVGAGELPPFLSVNIKVLVRHSVRSTSKVSKRVSCERSSPDDLRLPSRRDIIISIASGPVVINIVEK